MLLRKFEKTDTLALFEYLSDSEVLKYEPYKPFSLEQAAEEALKRAETPEFIAVCTTEGKLIGNLYFAEGNFNTWTLGYVFNKKYLGQGYASESVKLLLEYVFRETPIHRGVALCNPENKASWSLLERVGFRREGHLKKNVYFWKDETDQPVWQDTFEYGLLKDECASLLK
ncbi:GNAT family N-acetyltransferase [Enterococcus termitis]|uniref:GNAT family N-acetyltransferase n=1 Tax=Enterococcus termitis TaxID=332950 RepID=UPI00091CA295|nr:GNAT family N-acetyltransferase [Enterococcus termitis]OJG98382.1 GNAT family acetyltransferase [Enterococcus termitis]